MEEKAFKKEINCVWKLVEDRDFEELEAKYDEYMGEKEKGQYTLLLLGCISLILSKPMHHFIYGSIFDVDPNDIKKYKKFLKYVDKLICKTIDELINNEIIFVIGRIDREPIVLEEYYFSIEETIFQHCAEASAKCNESEKIKRYLSCMFQVYGYYFVYEPDNIFDSYLSLLEILENVAKKEEAKDVVEYANSVIPYFSELNNTFFDIIEEKSEKKEIIEPLVEFKNKFDFSPIFQLLSGLAFYDGSAKEKKVIESNLNKSIKSFYSGIDVIEGEIDDDAQIQQYVEQYLAKMQIDSDFDIKNIDYKKINLNTNRKTLFNIIYRDYKDNESLLKKARAALYLNEYPCAYEAYIQILKSHEANVYLTNIVNDIADISVKNTFKNNNPRYDGLHRLAREYDKHAEEILFVSLSKRVMKHLSDKMDEFCVTDLGDICSLMGRYVVGEEIDNEKFVATFRELTKTYEQCEQFLKEEGYPSRNSQVVLSKNSTKLYKKLADALSKMTVSMDVDVDLEDTLDIFDSIYTQWMFNRFFVANNKKELDAYLAIFIEFFEKLYSGELNYPDEEDEECEEVED